MKKEENKKERLTRECIRKDLMRQTKRDLLVTILIAMLASSLCYLTLELARKIDISLFRVLIFVLFWGVVAYAIVHSLYKSARWLHCLNKGKFYITTDHLLGFERKNSLLLSPGNLGSPVVKTYVLHFSRYDRFFLRHDMRYYKRLKGESLSDKDIFLCANVGDEFYMVVADGRDVMMIYNKKHFVLVEDEGF